MGAAAFILAGCEEQGGQTGSPPASTQQQPPARHGGDPMASNPAVGPAGPLKIELEAKKAGFEERAPDELKALYADGLQAVVDAGVVENARSMGDQAPDFTLTNQNGEEVSLSSLLEQGPVVLLWYRGGWCPYCNLTLAAYQDRLEDIRAQGATLVALTPELPDRSVSTAEKEELEFQVLSDVGNEVARKYGVVFTLTDGVKANYEQAFGLSDYNGDDSGELPLAATYVIDRDGTIRWAFLDADYRNRAEPEDVVRALERLNAERSGG
jgi:peroxiredoxin